MQTFISDLLGEPGRLDAFPDLLTGVEIARQMQVCFQSVPVPQPVWDDLARRLGVCQLSQLQAFSAWCRLRGLPWKQLGPTPVFGKQRTQIFAGTSGQRYPSDSSRGLDHLLPPGLGPEGDMKASRELSSPFSPRDWPELDVSFVVDSIRVWREFLPNVAQAQRDILKSIVRALRPLDVALKPFQCASAARVAATKSPAFVSCLSVLLRWPDLFQGYNLLHGYPIVGEVSPCGVFRPVTQDDKLPVEEWLGDDAIRTVEELVRSRPPRHFEDIYKVTVEEQNKGFCGPFETRLELDDKYGPGQWRPLERFMIIQADGKQRVIDNARKSGHNLHTAMSETITTVNVDFVACLGRMLATALFDSDSLPKDLPPWLGLRLGTDDLPDAYRGLPVCDEHLRFSIVAVFVPESGWRFATLFGLAYGLESALITGFLSLGLVSLGDVSWV